MNIYGLQISDSEENKRVSSLLTLEDKKVSDSPQTHLIFLVY